MPSPPEFHGRRLSAWVRELTGFGGEARANAIEFFRNEGGNTVPALVELLRRSKPTDSQWKPNYLCNILGIRFQNYLMARNFERANAITACGIIGSEAHPAIPTLLTLKGDKDSLVRLSLARALGEIQSAPSQSVPVLIEMLQDSSKYVRHTAAKSLGLYGPVAKVALPALTNAMSDSDSSVGIVARRTLEKIKELK